MTISARIGDLVKVLYQRLQHRASCRCSEVWSGKNFGVVTDALSMMVEAHGCALFVLDCNS